MNNNAAILRCVFVAGNLCRRSGRSVSQPHVVGQSGRVKNASAPCQVVYALVVAIFWIVYAHSKLHRNCIMEREDETLRPSVLHQLADQGPELLQNVVEQGDFTTEDLLNLTRTSRALRNAAARVVTREREELQAFVTDPPPTFEEILHRLQTRRKTAGGIRYAPGTTVQQVLSDIINQRYAQYGDDGPLDRVLISDLLAVLYSIYVANPSCAPTFEPYQTFTSFNERYVEARQQFANITFKWPSETKRRFIIEFGDCLFFLETDRMGRITPYLPKKPHNILFYSVNDLIKAYYNLNQAIKEGTVPPDSITIVEREKKQLLIKLLEQSGVFYNTTDAGGNPVVNARASFIDLALL